jgi:HK97 family phage portal protein
MSLFAAVLGGPAESRGMSTRELLESLASGAVSKSGAEVSITTALRVSTVLACARVITEDIAKMPFRVMQEQKSGRKAPAKEHPAYWLLRHKPNAWQTPMEFREAAGLHAFLARGAFSLVSRVRGEPREILPLVPSDVTVRRAGWEVEYEISNVGTFGPRDILHVRGPSWNGHDALAIVNLAREAIGLAMATEESQARLHRNGARPGGVLLYPTSLGDEQKGAIAKAWTAAFGGGNAFGTAVLDLGAKYERLAMTGVDAQHIETRKHQVEEICRMVRVYPSKIGHSDKTATFASAAEFSRAHVVDSLQPWMERWEQSATRALLTEEEVRDGFFLKLDARMLLEADPAARAAFYKASLGTASSPGWNTPNDIRRLEDQDPSSEPGADKLATVDTFASKKAGADGTGGGSDGSEAAP